MIIWFFPPWEKKKQLIPVDSCSKLLPSEKFYNWFILPTFGGFSPVNRFKVKLDYNPLVTKFNNWSEKLFVSRS